MPKGSREPAYKRAGFATQNAYSKARSAARDWSDDHSQRAESRYNSRMSPEAFKNYYRAFVSPVTSTAAVKERGGHKSRYLEPYLVNNLKVMTKDEFRAVYSELR